MKSLVTGAASALALVSFSAPALSAPPPVAAFGMLPDLQGAAISPDGQAVAMISGSAERRQLSISVIDNPTATVLELGTARASNVRWAGDGFLLVQVTSYEKPAWSKYSYNFVRDLIVTRDGKTKGWLLNNSPETGLAVDGLTIYRVVAGEKPFVLMRGMEGGVDTADNNSLFKDSHGTITPAVYKVDVSSGRGALAEKGDSADWAFDASGGSRAKVDRTALGVVLSARGKGQSAWKVLTTSKVGVTLYGYSDTEDAVYWGLEDGDDGALRVRKTSFPSGETALLPNAPANANVQMDPYTFAPVQMSEPDGSGKRWLDPAMQTAYASVSRAFKQKDVELVNWSRDRTRFVVRVSSLSAPASWYLYDAPRKNVSLIGDEYPNLKDVALGSKTLFTYSAADGLSIPAYLHLPVGGQAKNLPLVVLPHGGPASRDWPGFDLWAQFLASRGYAVLQPQFRGSDGFGAKLRTAGYQQWAGKMQTDLTDGVAYLVKQGTVDPKRVCIMGLSYGGYAALEGMVAHSDTYRCGISINGLSDLGQEILQDMRTLDHGDENDQNRWRSDALDYYGSGRAAIAAASPALHAADAKGPILLIYSAQDTTVAPMQTTEMADKLKAAGKPATVVALPGDDHQLRTSASRIAALTAIDEFLARNLPVSQ